MDFTLIGQKTRFWVNFFKKNLFRYFLLNWALNDDFRFNQYSRKLHDAESGPSSSSFSKDVWHIFSSFLVHSWYFCFISYHVVISNQYQVRQCMQAVPSHHRWWWLGAYFLVLRSLIKQRDNRNVFSKPTSRYSTCYCTIYPSFVAIPIYYSTPFGGVLFNCGFCSNRILHYFPMLVC